MPSFHARRFGASSLAVGLLASAPALVAAAPASAPPSAQARIDAQAREIQALRQSVADLKAVYDQRLAALEAQLRQAQATPAAASGAPATLTATATVDTSVAPAHAPAPAPAAEAPASPVSPAGPADTATAGNASSFNPSVSLILSGTYAHLSRDPGDDRFRGVALPTGLDRGFGTRGFSLAESELALSASVDPWLRGAINLSISPDDTITAEEAFVQSTSLPDGLGLKAGRFYSGIGYLNSQHSHTWDFVDAPIAYQAFLGTQLADDGLQLRWLAPTDQFIELGAELGRGRSFPGGFDNGGTGSNAPGMWALTAHTGGDIGDSSSWRAGLSLLRGRADDQSLVGTDLRTGDTIAEAFSGRTRVWVLDGVWKWAPGGNATRTNFKLQGEWLRSERAGGLALGGGPVAPWRQASSGGYVQAVWQFAPTWRVGVRTERLDPGSDPALPGDAGSPTKNSVMLDFSPSEFSRIRLQFARDQARAGAPDNQILLQYQTSLGAHGAHAY